MSIDGFAGFGLHFCMDGFRLIYLFVTLFMWLVALVFSKEYMKHYENKVRYFIFLVLTLLATVGVFLSADLYTTFIFFEIMSFTSYVWVAQDERRASLKAAETYLAVAIIGGMVMLMGLFLLQHILGTMEIAGLMEAVKACEKKGLLYAACGCVAFGFAAKAGVFPLHIWLPKAHPVAPAPASALLSGVLTKTGIFGLLIVSTAAMHGDAAWGSLMLSLGVITMFGGALLALFSVDLKRTLACSSMSQIGFIVVGIGMQGLLQEENALAARGTMLHMVNHSLIKLVLFVVAGIIFMNIHKLDLNEIRGYGRKKPFLHFVFLMGALGIGGIPLWNGYISKTLLHESIVEYTHILSETGMLTDGGWFGFLQMQWIEWIFLISGGLTLAYMTKLYVAVFIEKNADERVQAQYDEKKPYVSLVTKLLLLVAALMLPVMGGFPKRIMGKIADLGTVFMHAATLEHEVAYFNFVNLKGALVSVVIGAVVYVMVVRGLLMEKKESGKVYVNRWPAGLDLENALYRPLIGASCLILTFFARVCDSLVDGVVVLLRKTVYTDLELPFEPAEGNMFTYHLGRFLNAIEEYWEERYPDKEHKHHEYIHELALLNLRLQENRMVISRTLSFGLLLVCIGCLLMMIYLLGAHW